MGVYRMSMPDWLSGLSLILAYYKHRRPRASSQFLNTKKTCWCYEHIILFLNYLIEILFNVYSPNT